DDQHSVSATARHEAAVQKALRALGNPEGLVVGHKKDIVLTNRLLRKPDAVAIYGWHMPTPIPASQKPGIPTLPGLYPIQGLSTIHEAKYKDYSHAVRMVAPHGVLDGQVVPIAYVLQSTALSPLLSHEGPLQVLRHPRVPPPADRSLVPA